MRTVVYVLIIFSLGFLVHAFFFPNFLYKGLSPIKGIVLGINDKNSVNEAFNYSFLNYVNFSDGQFDKREITIRKGDYIIITNKDNKQLMWLMSDNPFLSTPRGYGLGEEVRTILNNVGTLTVVNKMNRSQMLTIHVIENH